MKKTRIFLIALLGCTSVWAQTNTFPTSGDVGIGTTSPEAPLHIVNGENTYGTILANAAESSFSLYTKTLVTQPLNVESFRLGLKNRSNENNGYISFYRGTNASGGFLGLATNGSERIRISKDGNVGIGTANPVAKLQVMGGVGINTGLTGNLSSGSVLAIGDTDTGLKQQGDGVLSIYTDNIERIRFSKSGNLGIGRSNPMSKLEVNGDISLARTHKLKFFETVNGGERAYIRSTDGEGGDYNSMIFAVGVGDESMIIKNDGNVGIGTTNPGIYKLAVNGNVRAKEIKVETGWSDFVFEGDYKLPTLEEVENHIKDKGHLKDIPSAEEVAENGILLGEMDSKLLQKIEELTLYTIAQEKRIKHLEKENETLKSITERVSKIEALVKAE